MGGPGDSHLVAYTGIGRRCSCRRRPLTPVTVTANAGRRAAWAAMQEGKGEAGDARRDSSSSNGSGGSSGGSSDDDATGTPRDSEAAAGPEEAWGEAPLTPTP
jgi:hypothetical protein